MKKPQTTLLDERLVELLSEKKVKLCLPKTHLRALIFWACEGASKMYGFAYERQLKEAFEILYFADRKMFNDTGLILSRSEKNRMIWRVYPNRKVRGVRK